MTTRNPFPRHIRNDDAACRRFLGYALLATRGERTRAQWTAWLKRNGISARLADRCVREIKLSFAS